MRLRLLFVSKGEDSPSTRYRALQFFPYWRAQGFEPKHVTASGGAIAIARMLRAAKWADIVVVIRKTFPKPLLWVLRRTAKRLIFDLDDSIFCNTDGTYSSTRMSRFAAMAKCCDQIWAGNAYLAQQAARFTTAATIVPTSIDIEKYNVTTAKPAETIDLVWIGSSSTKKYLVDALPWLASATKQVPNLRLKIIADFDLPDQGIETLPIGWTSDTEAYDLASSHIGIAPMRDDDWSRGKCALKVIQYMAAGLPVVSSACGANKEIVQNNVNGFLASTPDEWVSAIAVLAGNPTLRVHLGQAGLSQIRSGYSADAVFSRLVAAVDAAP